MYEGHHFSPFVRGAVVPLSTARHTPAPPLPTAAVRAPVRGSQDAGTAEPEEPRDEEVEVREEEVEMEDAPGPDPNPPVGITEDDGCRRHELMDADDELWGMSDVRRAILQLISAGQSEIPVQQLLELLPPYLPRVAIEACLTDLHHNLDADNNGNWVMYHNGTIQVIT